MFVDVFLVVLILRRLNYRCTCTSVRAKMCSDLPVCGTANIKSITLDT